MSNEFFDQWVRWEISRKEAQDTLPIFYYDNTALSAIFSASSAKVKDLLPHADMQPVEMWPGRCLVAFSAFEYRHTDIDPYNEVSISFLISFRERQIPGMTAARMVQSRSISTYIWQLPVTTEHALTAGVDLFGYPKFLADITFVRDQNWITCTLAENGQEIFSLRGPRLDTGLGEHWHYLTYSVEEGRPLVADVLVNPLEYAEAYNTSTVGLKLGTNHPVSDVLGQIRLGRRAIVYQYIPVNQAILFPPRNII